MSQELLNYSRYLIVVAHQDDEINCGALVKRLIDAGKVVKLICATQGDAGANPELRDDEMLRSIKTLGIEEENYTNLEIPELELFNNFNNLYSQIKTTSDNFKPECILTMDYDGGHEGHDVTNFIVNRVIEKNNITHIVYPDYHLRSMIHYGLEFLPGRNVDLTLELSEEEKNLKIKMLEAHSGQIAFFLHMQKRQENYFPLLFSREVYRIFPKDFDYISRPEYELAYEHYGNGFTFEDFKKAALSLEHSIN